MLKIVQKANKKKKFNKFKQFVKFGSSFLDEEKDATFDFLVDLDAGISNILIIKENRFIT
jgi:hypothetical protein